MGMVIQGVLPNNPKDFLMSRVKRLEDELEKTLTGPIKRRLKQSMWFRVRKWDHQPEFVGRYSKYKGAVGSMYVFPRGSNSQYWEWTSGGTQAHTISAKNKPTLAYRPHYTPHTRPGNVYGGPGVKNGNIVRPVSVKHPGTKPRHFEKYIKNDEEAFVIRNLDEAIRRALR